MYIWLGSGVRGECKGTWERAGTAKLNGDRFEIK